MPFSENVTGRTWADLADLWADLENTWLGTINILPTIEIGQFTGLILDDPEQGVLDQNILDGDVAYTVIPQGAYAFSTTRGRNRDLERTSAGQISVSLRNEDRFFDPIVGTFAEYTRPRLPVRASIDGLKVFTGYVDDWNYTFEPGGRSEASFSGSDGFSRFARNVNDGGSAVSESTGDRLDRVLSQPTLAYTGPRDIDNGKSTLAGGFLEDDALNYMLNVVEQSEQGLIFMAKDGTFTFRSRLLSTVGSAVTFSDGNGIPFSAIDIQYGSEDLVNQAIVTGSSGTAVSEDLTSQVIYGITAKTVDTELSSLAGQEGLADFIIAKYRKPELRIQSVTVNLNGLSSPEIAEVLSLEIGEQLDVSFTPNGIGVPIAVRSRVIGISHDVSLDSYFVTFNLEKLAFDFFVLDSPVAGKLDEADYVLGF